MIRQRKGKTVQNMNMQEEGFKIFAISRNNKEVARRLNVSETTVSLWRKKYHWDDEADDLKAKSQAEFARLRAEAWLENGKGLAKIKGKSIEVFNKKADEMDAKDAGSLAIKAMQTEHELYGMKGDDNGGSIVQNNLIIGDMDEADRSRLMARISGRLGKVAPGQAEGQTRK